jgi:cytochrome c peroxidase
MSCSSCHKQQFAFSDSPNRLSKGNRGKLLARNTLPLFNLVWYKEFFWDGRAKSLQQQAYFPVSSHDEMNLSWNEVVKRINNSTFYKKLFKKTFNKDRVDSSDIVNALVQFESSLISSNSKYDKVLRFETELTQDEIDGFELMNNMTKGDCLHCHTTDADPMGTTFKFSNNGLDKVQSPEQYTDKGKGNVSKKTNEREMVFKVKDMTEKRNNIGARIDDAGKDKVIKLLNTVINEFSPPYYTDENTTFINQLGICITIEILMRKFSEDRRDGKYYYLTPEQAILSDIIKKSF